SNLRSISNEEEIIDCANIIPAKSMPIITGKTHSGVSFDLQIGSIESLFSSNFVRLAFQLDPRQVLVYHWL
ncbi:hypothetical protein PMAYCL1PPCAC_13900, partial [Pristionchus mayeri]